MRQPKPAARWRRIGIEALERRELLAAILADDAYLFSGHVGVCGCPICTGEGLAPAVSQIGFAAAPGIGSPLTSLPQLRSNPAAAAKLFLDFDGHFEATWGSYSNVSTPAFDTDGDPTTFGSGELNAIQEIWQRVAEDYAPFNIDVTTIDPATQANNVAAIIAIGGSSSDWYGVTAGGISFIGGFHNSTSNVGYAFSATLGGSSKNVAEATAHEAGHLFGLQHQSRWNGEALVEQYHSGGNGWAPIMGISYAPLRTTWFNGATPFGPTILQDELAVLSGANNGFGWRADDFGNTSAAAAPLPVAGNSVLVSGLIGQNDDQDLWSFSTIGGPASWQLTGAPHGTNLDAVLELRNAAGQTIAVADPSDALGASITTTLASGTYYLLARSSGVYGSLGQYTIAGSVTRGPFPEIALRQGGATLTDGQVVDFGSTPLGAPVSLVFTITNEGDAALTLSPLNGTSLPAGFALEANLGQTTLGPGQSTTFTLRFTAATAGAFGGSLQLANDDADEQPFDLTLTGTVVVPDIAVRHNGSLLTDGQPLDLGSVVQGAATTHLFTVVNEGTDTLTLTPLDPASLPSGFSLVANFGSNTLAPGQTTTFSIRVNAVAGGSYAGTLQIVSSDPDERPFDLFLSVVVLAPEIDVQLGGGSVQDGQTIDFGLTVQGQAAVRTFNVTNTGSATLALTPLDAASLPAGFSLVANLGTASLPPGQTTSFAVQLTAAAGGNFAGALHLANGDSDENPFDLQLSGRVLAPEITVLAENVNVPDGGLVDFGATAVPLPVTRTITVRNDGLASLTLSPLIPSSLPLGFSLISNLGLTTLAPAQSTTFAVRLEAAAAGQFGGPIQLTSNDADESTYDISLAGRVTAPEIAVQLNGAELNDGGLVHFGNAVQGQPIERTFTVRNYGAAPLLLASLNPATLPAGFALVTNVANNSLAPGESTSFTLRLTANFAGSFGGSWALGNSDLDENPFDLQLSGTVTAPEIVVEVEGVGVADGGAINFGTTTAGVPVVRHVTISNAGAAPLLLTPLDPSGFPPGFTLVADQGLTTLAFGQSTSFIVRFQSAALGTRGGSIVVQSNDSDESPFDLELTGTVGTAEIDVLLGGQSLTDGQAVSFGSAVLGQSVSYVFGVVNRGTASLDLVPIVPASLPSGLSLVTNIAQTRLAPSASTSFTLRLDAAATGVFGGSLSLGNTDLDENPFDLTVSGTVTAPEIAAEVASANLTSGQTTDFGTTTRGTAVQRTFTLRNTGTASLQLAPLSAVNIPAGFALLSNIGQMALAPGQATSFAVRLIASVAGEYGGTISLVNDDADENPFRFVVRGRVLAPDITIRNGTNLLSDGQSVDFGTTLQGQPVDRTFSIVNDGQATLNLAPLSAYNLPAGFALAAPLGLTSLAPGQATSFTLRLTALAGGPVSEAFQVFSTAPDESPFDLLLSGTVLAPEIRIEVEGSELASGQALDFGGTVVGLSAERTITVRNVGTAALTLSPLDSTRLPSGFSIVANLPATSLAPGSSATATLRLVAAQSGAFGGIISLLSSDADENPFQLALAGNVSAPKIGVSLPGQALASGQAVDFGDLLVGASASRTLTVSNLGSAVLDLSPLTASLPLGFSVAAPLGQTRLPPGSSTSFTLQFDAQEAGSYGGSFPLISNDSASSSWILQLAGRAIASHLVLELDGTELSAGQTLDFGSAIQGQPVVRTLTLRNAGSAHLTIEPIDPASLPSGFSLTTNLSAVLLLPGQTTALSVRLEAAAPGSFAGGLTLTSNDAALSQFTLSLAGEVRAPEITVFVGGNPMADAGVVDFGSTPLGASSSRTFTVRNDGDAPLSLTPLNSGSLPAGYSLIDNLGAVELAPGGQTAFTLRLGGTTAGEYSGSVHLVNGDADESPFALQLRGVLAAPEIAVSVEGVELFTGQTFDWGDTLRGTPLVKNVTITNTGSAPLDVTPLNPAAVPPGFLLLANIGSTTLQPGASASLTLRLDATAVGTFGGEISFGNSDADESPFRLMLRATVVDPTLVHAVVNLPAGGDFTLDHHAGRLRLRRGAETLFARSPATVASLTLNGTPQRESLSVSLPGGNPIPAGGLHFAAGDSLLGDVLSIAGSGGEAAEWTAGDLAASAGTIHVGERSVFYTGVRALDLTGLGTARLQLAGAAHALEIDSGLTRSTALPALVVQGSAAGQTLPAIALRGNGTVVIAAGTAADVVSLRGGENGHGNHSLNIDTGIAAGDRIDVTGAALFAGAVQLVSGEIEFPSFDSRLSAAQVMLNAAGEIVDRTPDDPSVIGNSLTANAGSGITLGTATPLIHARVTGPGNLDLQLAGDANLLEAHVADGSIQIVAGGTLTAGSVTSDAPAARDIALTSLAGDILIGSIGGGTGAAPNVSLVAAQSVRSQGPPAAIRAGVLTISAGLAIGEAGASLPIAALSLTAAAGSGGVYVAAASDLATTISAAAGVHLVAAGNLTVSGGVTTSGMASSLSLAAGRDLTVGAGSSVTALGDVHLAFGQNGFSSATATLTGQVVSVAGILVEGGVGADRFIVASPLVFAAPHVTLRGGAGNDSFAVTPQRQAPLAVYGGLSPGSSPGDTLELDLTAAAADAAATAIVSAALASKAAGGSGIALVTGHGQVEFGELEGFALRDQESLTGVVLGGLYVRGSQGHDILEVAPTGAGGSHVQVRVNEAIYVLPRPERTLIVGRGGNDTLAQTGLGSPVELSGDAGDDVLTGDGASDILSGGEGRDALEGQAGDDYLSGGAGDDTLRGGAGKDRLYGGAGRDALFGEEGDDAIVASDGRDQLHGGDGRDVLIGGTGADRLSGFEGDDLLIGGRLLANGVTSSSAYRDAYDMALESVLAEWSAGGRLDPLLEILTDYSADELYGGDGSDTAASGVGDIGDWEHLLP